MNSACSCDPLLAAISGLTRLWAQRQGIIVEMEVLDPPEPGSPGMGVTASAAVDGLILCELMQLSLQAMTRPDVQFLYVCMDMRHPTQWRLEVADDTSHVPAHAQDASTLDPTAWQQLLTRLHSLPVQWSLQRAPVEGRLLVLEGLAAAS